MKKYLSNKWGKHLAVSLVLVSYLLLLIWGRQAQALDKLAARSLEPGIAYSGIVGDRDRYSFSLAASQAIVLEVSQPNTDVKLVLSDNSFSPAKEVFAASIPARSWLPEKVLVSAELCSRCLLQLAPVNNADKSGSYTLTAISLSSELHQGEIDFAAVMTRAAITWLRVDEQQANFDQVFKLYLKAIALADNFSAVNSEMKGAKIRSLYLASQAAHWLGNYQVQQEFVTRVIALSENDRDQYRLNATFDLGVIAYENKQFEHSTRYLTRARELAQLQGHKLMQAKILSRLGLIAGGEGRQGEAGQYFEQAYQVFISSGDWRSTIEGLINLGWSHLHHGSLGLALNYYHQARSFAAKAELPNLEAQALIGIGSSYGRMGDIDQAIRFVDQALTQSVKFSYVFFHARALQAKAQILLNAGMFELAGDVFEEAYLAYGKVNAVADQINIRYFLGKVHNSLGSYAKAEDYYREVLAYDKQTGNHLDIGSGYNRLAETALEQKHYARALTYQQQALDYLQDADDSHVKGRLYSQSALVYFFNGLTHESSAYFRRARQLQQELKDYAGLITTGYRMAIAEAVNGNKKQAVQALDQVIAYIQQQQQHVSRGDLRRSFLAQQQKIIGLQIGLMRDTRSDALETLELSEMFRSQTLNEWLRDLSKAKPVPPELAKKRAQLQQTLQSQVISYHQLADAVSREQIIRETRKTAYQLQQLEAAFQTGKADDKPGEIKSADIRQIQQGLDLNSLILYFDTNAGESYLWTVAKNNIELYSLPSNQVLSDQVLAVLLQVRDSPGSQHSNRSRQQKQAIKQLSDTLFLGKDIPWQQYDNLLIVPDGALNYLPLSMLTLPGQGSLVESKQVSYMPSLGVLSQLLNREVQSREGNKILLLANPAMLQAGNADEEFARVRVGFETGELPYTEKEANSIIEIAGNRVSLLSRKNASKSQLRAQALADYQIIHFATHGLASTDEPALAGLVLSNALSDDNLLLAPEIINLDINAELVVLSGCETALGRLIDGEGLQGLSRVFFEAGTRRVVASLWSVQDDATAKLMGAFYQFLLKEKKAPGEALRLAKLEVKNYQRRNRQKPWKDPFYWAGFVLQGPGGAWFD
ncbi:CHAT domain-containing tetratricopeptide repeat protein [Thalassomonas actiniarum]|uniref:CHAT domain-containing protein n=1 Tax=Thalassomonas actiniarum TaxID=485447 RepID=A0AAE9YSI3_9GAMM|nr:CHAT domain-containing protein [Thalassomonas actiniarum]WDD99643.1 CHAT domain-containing protein [Thalassomonas actiniarum]